MSGPPPKPPPSVLGLPPVPFSKLYTFATNADTIAVSLACACGAASGAILPLFSLVFGAALNSLNDTSTSIVDKINSLSLLFLYIAIAASGLSFLESYLVISSTERQVRRMREAYARNLLRLDTAWYDTHRAGEAVSRLAEASASVATGMEKVASVCRYSATLVCGLAIGFSTSWKLTLVIMASAPLFAAALIVLILTAIRTEKEERTAYGRAGDAATETFSLIRAVAAFGGERAASKRYGQFLAAAEAAGIRKGLGIGSAVGAMLATFYAMYAISTYAGAQFIIASRADNPSCRYIPTLSGCFSGGTVVTTFVSVLLGSLAFSQIGPLMGQISSARAAASDLFGVIEATPSVDVDAPGGHGSSPEDKVGAGGVSIEFRAVTFAYPSRPTTLILQDFSLLISAGEAVGVVGASGSGKSTLCALAMRAYDVSQGSVLVNGVDVKAWHLPALRALLGYVSQDPVLFGVSIRENIAMGVPGQLAALVSQEAVEEAAKASNAHAFVAALPQGYDTLAGASTSASQLSGGQKQRVCIARALVRKPRLLLLDEATSALDTASERAVQGALDAIASAGGRTMVVVAHRLSTLRNVHRIVVLKEGRLIESGSPAELESKEGGVYRAMLAAQQVSDPGAAAAAGAAAAEGTAAAVATSTALTAQVSSSPQEGAPPAAAVTAAAAAASPAQAPASMYSRLWAYQRRDVWFFLLGILGSCVSGSIQPIVSIVYGGIITVYYNPDDNELRTQSLNYLGYFFLLAGVVAVGVLCRVSVLTYIGERLTRRLRQECFNALTRQPAGFFDKADNSVGRLSIRLATDAAAVKGATGEAMGTSIEGAAAIAAAIAIAFSKSWRLALVLLGAFPLLVLGGWFEFKAVAQVQKGGNKDLENAGELLSESIGATRTVAAYGLQPRTYAVFSAALQAPLDSGLRRALVTGAGSGFQRFILMCTYSVAFYAGAQFISAGQLQFDGLIMTFLAVTLAAEAVGRISAQAPDTAKAAVAAQAVLALIDLGEASPADPYAAAGYAGEGSTPASGLEIVFEKVTFAYPSRPDTPVLRDFSATIPAGQFVGIVGSSGSGKSTLVLLLLRFYDVGAGRITVGGVDVRQWNVTRLRQCFGLVQQEPALFADSIGYNIEYGKASADKPEAGMGVQPLETGDKGEEGGGSSAADPKAKAPSAGEAVAVPVAAAAPVTYPPPSAEVVAAAEAANAAGFIGEFKDKYATYCGSRGSQLSGGQKQRVAISRALFRNPPVLLLDEATAALDSHSEEIVQAALDAVIASARGGRSREWPLLACLRVCVLLPLTYSHSHTTHFHHYCRHHAVHCP
jgi:ATP-binding cassette subfamily B (MDR/TAP) protein 1